jgi:site-specific recombinase XerD
MRLLHAGIDIAVIALWLGHEHLATAEIYLNPRELHQMHDLNWSFRELAA